MNKLKMISDMTVNCLTSFRRPLRKNGLLMEKPILSVVILRVKRISKRLLHSLQSGRLIKT